MLSISKMADYSVVLLTVFVVSYKKNEIFTSVDLAEKTKIPLPSVSKILKLLTKGNVLESVRGAYGGYKLSKSPEEISIYDVIVSIDGPIALTACVKSSDEVCSSEDFCIMKGGWDKLNKAVEKSFKAINIKEICIMFH